MAEVTKSRPVLGDVTNLLGKRGFSEIEKIGVGNDNSVTTPKPPCIETNSLKCNAVLGTSRITNGNSEVKVLQFGCNEGSKGSIEDCNYGTCLNGRNIVTGNSQVCVGDKDIKILFTKLDVGNDSVDNCGEIGSSADDALLPNMDKLASRNHKFPKLTILEEGGRALWALKSVKTEVDEELGDSFLSGTSNTVSDYKDFDGEEAEATLQGTKKSETNDYELNGDDNNADNLVLSQCGSIDPTFLPESQESRVFGVEKSVELNKGDECAYTSAGTDSIKACSCSFCTKAMKKSQKEARILAERANRSKVIGKHSAESYSGVSYLESDLMYQWKFLFQGMVDIWQKESNQLETRLLPLTDLREKCKTDLELINAAPTEH